MLMLYFGGNEILGTIIFIIFLIKINDITKVMGCCWLGKPMCFEHKNVGCIKIVNISKPVHWILRKFS
jgi:hypothetical protein